MMAAIEETLPRLAKLAEVHRDSHDGLGIFAEEVLICFIVGDFFIYAEHRLMHAVAADSQTLAH